MTRFDGVSFGGPASVLHRILVLMIIILLPTSALSQDKFTPFELRQMTNDPETNPALSHFAEKIEPPLAEALKTVQLAKIVSSCPGSTPVQATLDAYIKRNISKATSSERSDANFIAHRKFQGLTYIDFAQLCAGVDYLFGPKGVLLANAVKAGTKKTTVPSNQELNPYLVLPN